MKIEFKLPEWMSKEEFADKIGRGLELAMKRVEEYEREERRKTTQYWPIFYLNDFWLSEREKEMIRKHLWLDTDEDEDNDCWYCKEERDNLQKAVHWFGDWLLNSLVNEKLWSGVLHAIEDQRRIDDGEKRQAKIWLLIVSMMDGIEVTLNTKKK